MPPAMWPREKGVRHGEATELLLGGCRPCPDLCLSDLSGGTALEQSRGHPTPYEPKSAQPTGSTFSAWWSIDWRTSLVRACEVDNHSYFNPTPDPGRTHQNPQVLIGQGVTSI